MIGDVTFGYSLFMILDRCLLLLYNTAYRRLFPVDIWVFDLLVVTIACIYIYISGLDWIAFILLA